MKPVSKQSAHTLTFAQAWQPEISAGFNPGSVQVTLQGETLLVEAKLTDPYIKDYPASFNEPVYEKGDVFELFLMAEGDNHYHEVHVSPSNSLLQLRVSCDRRPQSMEDVDAVKTWEPLLDSSTELADGGWQARFSCVLSRFTEQRPLPVRWKIACGRYDYPENDPLPVISNTAPFTAPDFHRYWEWPVLDFA